MPINFPASPTTNQTYTYSGKTWTWNGAAWTLTNATVTSTVGVINGGTGITTYTTGDILYASATNVLSKLAAGTSGQALTINSSGVPAWASSSSAAGNIFLANNFGGL
jgi:hypothetical protein